MFFETTYIFLQHLFYIAEISTSINKWPVKKPNFLHRLGDKDHASYQTCQATCCGGGVVVVLKMILIWEFRVVGILIRGGDDMHEREIKKKFVFN